MHIANPGYVEPRTAEADRLADRLQALFAANPGKQCFTLDELHSAMPDESEDLTPEVLALVARRRGWMIFGGGG